METFSQDLRNISCEIPNKTSDWTSKNFPRVHITTPVKSSKQIPWLVRVWCREGVVCENSRFHFHGWYWLRPTVGRSGLMREESRNSCRGRNLENRDALTGSSRHSAAQRTELPRWTNVSYAYSWKKGIEETRWETLDADQAAREFAKVARKSWKIHKPQAELIESWKRHESSFKRCTCTLEARRINNQCQEGGCKTEKQATRAKKLHNCVATCEKHKRFRRLYQKIKQLKGY